MLFEKPYSPEGTGKIEKFNQNIHRFLDEYKFVNSVRSLENMNERFWIWLEEFYPNRQHTALNAKSPVQTYNLNSTPLKFLPSDQVANASLRAEARRVDKSGCITLASKGLNTKRGCPMRLEISMLSMIRETLWN